MLDMDIEDRRIQVRLAEAPGNRARFTITYPREPRYRRMVQDALSEFFSPGIREAIRRQREQEDTYHAKAAV